MQLFKPEFESTRRTWLLRIGSLVAVVAVIAGIGIFFRRGNTTGAILLLVSAPAFAVVFARCWTGFLFTSLESVKSYVRGAEGDHRHEWYAFKGQRVRVFLDAAEQPWFAVNEIAYILDIKVDKTTFRNYGAQEYGVPETASEPCLSERGLRRLIKYSKHSDAGLLGLWLERDVLRSLRTRKERA